MVRDKVLIVDDREAQRDVFSSMVGRIGKVKDVQFDILTACDGIDGLEKLVSLNPDEVVAIILDRDMPNMNGYEMALKIHADYPNHTNVPVIAVGGFEYNEINKMRSLYGKNLIVMGKPVKMTPLTECLIKYANRE